MLGQIPIAFVAGLVSFLAPCVLPLVPGYLSRSRPSRRTGSASAASDFVSFAPHRVLVVLLVLVLLHASIDQLAEAGGLVCVAIVLLAMFLVAPRLTLRDRRPLVPGDRGPPVQGCPLVGAGRALNTSVLPLQL